MENEKDDNKNWKKRVVPFFWTGGAFLTGTLIAFAITFIHKNDQMSIMEQKLAETSATSTREREALSNELKQTILHFDTLKTNHDALIACFKEEQSRNAQLKSANSSCAKREQQSQPG
jgi:hypothetical protein